MKTSALRGFDRVETWVFDLDNTLYPHHLNLWQQVDERIRLYIERLLNLSKEDAFRLQKDYYRRYGTTLRGLMLEHGMQPDEFLDFVHEIDHSPLEPNPQLGAAIAQLPGRKLILTNGTRKHADAVMQRLAIHEHFEDVSTSWRRSWSRSRHRRSTTVSSRAMASIRAKRRCSRIWRAISRRRMRWA